jgi:hypothetical protein
MGMRPIPMATWLRLSDNRFTQPATEGYPYASTVSLEVSRVRFYFGVGSSGWLTAYLSLVGILAAIVIDYYVARDAVSNLPETRLPPGPLSWAQGR